MSFSVILPTYNEAGHISELINIIILTFKNKNIHKFEIIIIDDNSEDNTAEIVKKNYNSNDYVVIINRKNKKKSLVDSLNEGLKISKYNYAIWMDADFQHPPEYLSKFVDNIENNDVIIFSRFTEGSKRFFTNKNDKVKNTDMSIFLNFVCNKFLYKDISDYTSGFICIKKKFLPERLEGYYGDYFINLVSYFKNKNAAVLELPFDEKKRKTGISKTTSGNFKYLIKLFFYFIAFLKALLKKKK